MHDLGEKDGSMAFRIMRSFVMLFSLASLAVLLSIPAWGVTPSEAPSGTPAASAGAVQTPPDPLPSAPESGGGTLEGGVDPQDALKTTTAELLLAQTSLDGRLVVFSGEVIGDAIDADRGHKWILVSDDGSALSVRMTDNHAGLIENYGKYGMKGTELRITGTYHVADPAQAGELNVTAENVEIIAHGGPVEMPVDTWKLYAGVAFFVAAGVLVLLYRYLQKRSI